MSKKKAQQKPVSYFLENESRLDEISESTLKSRMENAPFDQSLKLLFSKKMKREQRLSDKMLQLASTFAPDRENLYIQLHSDPAALKGSDIKSEKEGNKVKENIVEKSEEKEKGVKSSVLALEPMQSKVEEEKSAFSDSESLTEVPEEKASDEKQNDSSKKKSDKKKKKKKKIQKDRTALESTDNPEDKKRKKRAGKQKKTSYVYVRPERNMSSQFELDDYTGISKYSNWLLSMRQEDPEPVKIEKKKKKSKKKKKGKHKIKKDEMVISEALADLLSKQGHRKKARKMYKKLSLIFPEKSAYFAAKIENLKK